MFTVSVNWKKTVSWVPVCVKIISFNMFIKSQTVLLQVDIGGSDDEPGLPKQAKKTVKWNQIVNVPFITLV